MQGGVTGLQAKVQHLSQNTLSLSPRFLSLFRPSRSVCFLLSFLRSFVLSFFLPFIFFCFPSVFLSVSLYFVISFFRSFLSVFRSLFIYLMLFHVFLFVVLSFFLSPLIPLGFPCSDSFGLFLVRFLLFY